MPIRPDSIKPPASPVARTYTPPNGHKYPLQTGDSWASLAATVGMAPWDLIRYNYPGLPVDLQQAAKEVNWYLQNYNRCTLLTPDNRNFRFGPPGEIWLPNVAAALTPDQIARNRVLSILRGPIVRRMNFGVGFLIISATYYEDVAKAIDAGKITVKVNPALTNLAYYYGYNSDPNGPNRIEVSPTIADMGLVVHECTHAIFDMRRLTTNVQQSEGFGYLSQALYGWLQRGGPAGSRYLVSADPVNPISQAAWQIIFDESTRLAGILARNFWVSEEAAAALYWAVQNAKHAGYDGRVGKVETNDGI